MMKFSTPRRLSGETFQIPTENTTLTVRKIISPRVVSPSVQLVPKPNGKKIMDKTQRGFSIENFKDLYGEECSIQKSSLATEDAIWFGIDNPDLTVFEDENMGKYLITKMPKHFSVSSRMHLSRAQVEKLLPILQKFVETGELEDYD